MYFYFGTVLISCCFTVVNEDCWLFTLRHLSKRHILSCLYFSLSFIKLFVFNVSHLLRLSSIPIMKWPRATSPTTPWNVTVNTMDIESGSTTAMLVRSEKHWHRFLSKYFIFVTDSFTCFSSCTGDAFSEEAERRFEKYPGQLNNQIS